jgi:hypothetical protein
MASLTDYLFGSGSSGGYTNPATAAMPYLNQIPQYFNSYFNAGQKALPQLLGTYSSMATPGGATNNYNQLASSFTASPGYQYNVDQATQGANAAAAAGGQAGSPAEQQALAGQISGISAQDFNNYMAQVMGLQSQGLQGLSGINQMGYEAGSDLSRNLQSQAMLAYKGQAGQNQYNANESKNMWDTLGSMAGGFAGYFL